MFYQKASLDKLRAVLAFVQTPQPLSAMDLSVLLLSADVAHFLDYGRPIYGETWYRYHGVAEGVLLRAVLQSPRALGLNAFYQPLGSADLPGLLLSVSDQHALTKARHTPTPWPIDAGDGPLEWRTLIHDHEDFEMMQQVLMF